MYGLCDTFLCYNPLHTRCIDCNEDFCEEHAESHAQHRTIEAKKILAKGKLLRKVRDNDRSNKRKRT